jgi:RHS repeat-associated protein
VPNVTTTYGYDNGNNRLTKAVLSGGTTVTTNYNYNTLNQLTSYSDTGDTRAVSLGYDYDGNRTTRTVTGGTDNGTDTYTYDFENRLIGLVKGTAGGAGTYAYTYDYRTRRIVRDESSAGGSVTDLIFSGGTSVQEYTGSITSSNLTVEYLRGSDYGGGVGGILYTLRGGTPSYTHENKRGDVVAKTDGTGTLTYQAQYEAFGKQTATTGSTLDRQKSNSKDTDPTGLVDEGMRYRDLETGMFINRDPAGFVDGPNLYTYVVQNPWTKFDPEGLDATNTTPTPPPTPAPTAPAASTGSSPKPAPSASPSPSARADAPKLGIGIQPPGKVDKDGTQEISSKGAGADPGHTFAYVRNSKGEIVDVQSYGPAETITPGNADDFKKGNIKGNGNFGMEGNANTWEIPITKDQEAQAIQKIDAFKANPPNYTATCQCTSVTVDLANGVGVPVPSGKGPVTVDTGRIFSSKTTATVPNPAALQQQMTKQYGPSTTSDAASIDAATHQLPIQP